MKDLREQFDLAREFHGHKCPAMPMGLRAGRAALAALGVERSQDKELFVEAELGKGHAAACFVDGVMAATGCTYGKANIRKLYYNKMAITLINQRDGRAVRVSVKPDFFAKALASPFVQQRSKGVPPQEIPAEIVDPQVERVLSLPEEAFLDIGEIHQVEVEPPKPMFDARPCASCGEMTFINRLRPRADGELVCIPCSGYER